MIIILSSLLGIAISIGAWFLYLYLLSLWSDYQANLSNQTKQTLDDLFLFLDINKVKSLSLLFMIIGMLFIAWLVGQLWAVLPIFVVLIFSPKLILIYIRNKRNNRFDQQLPDLLMSLSGAVKAGSSLQQALQNTISHMKDGPVADEFNLLMREQRLGVDLAQALAQLKKRVPTEACILVVSALTIASQTGGSLALTLENIASTIRTRNHWLARVKALTAQGRMQSLIMAVLPFILFFILQYLEPEAMSLLWQTWFGFVFLIVILILETVGIFWIRKIANIEV